jgi:hypothetical protein
MVRSATHTFHTRHDFTPELGWAAFQLVHELGRAGLPQGGLGAIPFDGDISHSHLIPCVYHERRHQGGCDEDGRGTVFAAGR